MAASKNPRARLLNILDEIDGVTDALVGINFDQYQNSYVLRRTAERAVQIISEAVKSLPEDYLSQYPDQPWSAIAGIGNILRHEYQTIDDMRLWDTATVHIPKLRLAIVRMLEELESSDGRN